MKYLALVMLALSSTPAFAAKKTSGVEVEVVVKDANDVPIPTAVVREPREQDRHRVNAELGSWKASSLYLPDGTEIQFTAGQTVQLEVSAPNYQTELVEYTVRKRRNTVVVVLQAIEMSDDTLEEPIITFKQDKPRETTGDQ